MLKNKTILIAILMLSLAGASCTRSNEPSPSTEINTSGLVDVGNVPDFVPNDERGRALWDPTRQVYTLRQFQPAWSANDNVDANAEAALRVLEASAAEGLHPEDFDVPELRRLHDALKTGSNAAAEGELRSDFDKRLTYALVRYVSGLCFGRIDPKAVNPEWPAAQNDCDVPSIVNDAVNNKTVDSLADQLSPQIPEYQGLRSTLKRYREIGEPSSQSESEAAQKLALLGDLPADTDAAPSRKALNDAIRRFQARHGLEPDGRLGKKTAEALNVPIAERIEQIEINMDRMRWIAHRLEPKHIRVNIPGFELSIHDGQEVPLQMRSIVGSKENPTPVLDGKLEYLVFSPYWNIPLSIATKEFLPKVQKDPGYLRRENIEIVRIGGDNKADVVDASKINWKKESDLSGYRLRQKPGDKNALGLVKFIFPNPYDVYLHDTPSDNLFGRLTRTLSHGCIRVEQPRELAAYLLQDQPEWSPQNIEDAMHAEKEKRVSLKTTVPIHLVYWTAWADSEGNVQFREDVYGYDQTQRELTTPPSVLPAAHAPNVDVDKVGSRIIPDSTSLHRESRLSK